jgi:hypothetical protein
MQYDIDNFSSHPVRDVEVGSDIVGYEDLHSSHQFDFVRQLCYRSPNIGQFALKT